MTKVQINYKSGNAVTIKCDAFSITRTIDNEIREVRWTNATPTPMHVGVDEIESIYEL